MHGRDAPSTGLYRDGQKMDVPGERVFARSSVAFMVVAEKTVMILETRRTVVAWRGGGGGRAKKKR